MVMRCHFRPFEVCFFKRDATANFSTPETWITFMYISLIVAYNFESR